MPHRTSGKQAGDVDVLGNECPMARYGVRQARPYGRGNDENMAVTREGTKGHTAQQQPQHAARTSGGQREGQPRLHTICVSSDQRGKV